MSRSKRKPGPQRAEGPKVDEELAATSIWQKFRAPYDIPDVVLAQIIADWTRLLVDRDVRCQYEYPGGFWHDFVPIESLIWYVGSKTLFFSKMHNCDEDRVRAWLDHIREGQQCTYRTQNGRRCQDKSQGARERNSPTRFVAGETDRCFRHQETGIYGIGENVAWKDLIRRGAHLGNYGKGWTEFPCLAITKSGLTFNVPALGAYKIEAGRYLAVLYDEERRLLGFKTAETNGDFENACKVTPLSKGAKGVKIHATLIAKTFPDCVGHAYRLQLNAGERIIECDLSPGNMV